MAKDYKIPLESFEKSGINPVAGASIAIKLSSGKIVHGTISSIEKDFAILSEKNKGLSK